MLRVNNVSFWYDSEKPPIVHHADVAVAPNEFVAIVGGSGSGKTTLLRLACGLLQREVARHSERRYAYTGTVEWQGKPLLDVAEPFGYVPQNFHAALAPWLTAEENVFLGNRSLAEGVRQMVGGAHRIAAENRKRSACEFERLTGIDRVAQLNVRRLSGGQKQRVVLCRALLQSPQYLFMDEPFANLDPGLRPRMTDVLDRIRKHRGLAVVVVTHEVREACSLADRVVGVKRVEGLPTYKEWVRPSRPEEIELWCRDP